MISVFGIGWINKQEYGCKKNEVSFLYNKSKDHTLLPKKDELFSYPFKNFGRLDPISKMTCYAVALTLKDGGRQYELNTKLDIGIIGTNRYGCLNSDILYFKDYLDSGRTLSRGNLFLYTLPSSPIAEAAIHFGLQGPALYVTSSEQSMSIVMSSASKMILNEEVPSMLVGTAEENESIYFYIGKDSLHNGESICELPCIQKALSKDHNLSGLITELSYLKEGK